MCTLTSLSKCLLKLSLDNHVFNCFSFLISLHENVICIDIDAFSTFQEDSIQRRKTPALQIIISFFLNFHRLLSKQILCDVVTCSAEWTRVTWFDARRDKCCFFRCAPIDTHIKANYKRNVCSVCTIRSRHQISKLFMRPSSENANSSHQKWRAQWR